MKCKKLLKTMRFHGAASCMRRLLHYNAENPDAAHMEAPTLTRNLQKQREDIRFQK